MAIQQLNAEMVDLLRAYFQDRNEPNFAWKSCVSSVLALPGLRAFYPMSAVGAAGEAQDISTLGQHMARTADPDFRVQNLIPYSNYNGVADYHSVADNAAHRIIGTEAYIGATFRGLTMGLWVKTNDLQAGTVHLFAKYEAAVNNRSYTIYQNAGTVTFRVYDAANNPFDVSLAGYAADSTWHFIWGRYETSGDLTVGINNVTNTNIGAGPAALFNSTADLTIGARSGGVVFAAADVSMAWLCCQQLSDSILSVLWEQQRSMFGV